MGRDRYATRNKERVAFRALPPRHEGRDFTRIMMNSHSDICIIGNGAIGKTAALGFAQAGARVTLIEAPSAVRLATVSAGLATTDLVPHRALDWDLRVYAVNPMAQALLTRIKVWDALQQERVTTVDAMVVRGDHDTHPGQITFDAYAARVGALAHIVEDRNLNQALDTALRFASNIVRIPGVPSALDVTASDALVRLENDDTIRAALVVGADGAQSWVRAQAGINFDYRPYGQSAIVATFLAALPHRGMAYQWFSAQEGIVALLPLADNHVSLVWSVPDAMAASLLALSPEALAARVSVFCTAPLGLLQPAASGAVTAFPLALIRPHAITSSRVALIGDAAHVVHPLAGQGMNLGFADIESLLEAVAGRGAQRDAGDARVLARYARQRKEAILVMQLATDGLQRLFAVDFEPLRIARNIGLNLINKMAPVKRRLIAHAMGHTM